MSADLAAACGRLRTASRGEIERWRSSGRKQDYFAAVQAATLPFNLTGRAQTTPSMADKLFSDAPDGAKYSPRIAVVGDSISRELHHALVAVLGPTANVEFASVNTPACMQAPPLTRSWLRAATFAIGEAGMKDLETCKLDALFLGGYGPWSLRRFERHELVGLVAKSPILAHEAFIERELEIMQCVARRTETPVVYVGAIPIDGRTLLMEPPKADWYKFFDFGLATALAEADENVFDTFVGRANNIGKQAQHSDSSPPAPGHGRLHMLRLRELTDSCPGVRCDGMHFGSDFDQFSCHRTTAVWYPFLVSFLRRTGLLDPVMRRWRPKRPTESQFGTGSWCRRSAGALRSSNGTLTGSVFHACQLESEMGSRQRGITTRFSPIGGRR